VLFSCVLSDRVLRDFLVVSQNPSMFGSGVVVDVSWIVYGLSVAR
jgi:hypothetical protein